MSDDGYATGFSITYVLTFFVCWIGCTISFGFLGFALGWMPSLIVAGIIGALWPLLLLIVIGAAAVVLANLK